jgi:phosphonopyruvate decarboxylase
MRVSPEKIVQQFQKEEIRFFCGVPDSLLKGFCSYLVERTSQTEHVITANEGNAVALAAGHFLGSGNPALVYMQNSGVGNAINPLLSLVDKEVYSIPMICLVGWRGEPGIKDEPQHIKQGRVSTDLFDAMEIPWFVLDAETPDPLELISKAASCMWDKMGPVMILVRKGAFEAYKHTIDNSIDLPMTREVAIQSIVNILDEEDIVVSTTGKASRELNEYRISQGKALGKDFLTVGSMGHTASIAMGIALKQPMRQVICLDGDGSAIMHLGGMAIIGQQRMFNFTHIILNNGVHDSVGGMPTVGFKIDFVKIADACGYTTVSSVSTFEELKVKLKKLNRSGTTFLEIKVNTGSRSNLGRPEATPIQNRDALMEALKVQNL